MLDGSGEKAEFGAESCEAVEVTQGDSTPVAELVQPAGNAGGVTPSKFCEKNVVTMTLPKRKAKLTVPRLVAPSCNWSVAMLVSPQLPPAAKVKARATATPPARSAPYVRGPLGETTPPLAWSVATRL